MDPQEPQTQAPSCRFLPAGLHQPGGEACLQLQGGWEVLPSPGPVSSIDWKSGAAGDLRQALPPQGTCDDLSGLGDVGGAETLWTKILCPYHYKAPITGGRGGRKLPCMELPKYQAEFAAMRRRRGSLRSLVIFESEASQTQGYGLPKTEAGSE